MNWMRKIICPECGIMFKVKQAFWHQAWKMSGTIYCPNGCCIQFKRFVGMKVSKK